MSTGHSTLEPTPIECRSAARREDRCPAPVRRPRQYETLGSFIDPRHEPFTNCGTGPTWLGRWPILASWRTAGPNRNGGSPTPPMDSRGGTCPPWRKRAPNSWAATRNPLGRPGVNVRARMCAPRDRRSTNWEIAAPFGISHPTIEEHVESVPTGQDRRPFPHLAASRRLARPAAAPPLRSDTSGIRVVPDVPRAVPWHHGGESPAAERLTRPL